MQKGNCSVYFNDNSFKLRKYNSFCKKSFNPLSLGVCSCSICNNKNLNQNIEEEPIPLLKTSQELLHDEGVKSLKVSEIFRLLLIKEKYQKNSAIRIPETILFKNGLPEILIKFHEQSQTIQFTSKKTILQLNELLKIFMKKNRQRKKENNQALNDHLIKLKKGENNNTSQNVSIHSIDDNKEIKINDIASVGYDNESNQIYELFPFSNLMNLRPSWKGWQSISYIQACIPVINGITKNIIIQFSVPYEKETRNIIYNNDYSENNIPNSCLKICFEICNYIYTVHNMEILEMSCFFVVDASEKIWFLRSENISYRMKSKELRRKVVTTTKNKYWNKISFDHPGLSTIDPILVNSFIVSKTHENFPIKYNFSLPSFVTVLSNIKRKRREEKNKLRNEEEITRYQDHFNSKINYLRSSPSPEIQSKRTQNVKKIFPYFNTSNQFFGSKTLINHLSSLRSSNASQSQNNDYSNFDNSDYSSINSQSNSFSNKLGYKSIFRDVRKIGMAFDKKRRILIRESFLMPKNLLL